MSHRIAFPPYRPVPLDRLFRGGTPDQYGCIATAEPVLQALEGWNNVASQYEGLQACINETLKSAPGIENVQVIDVGSFFPGMGAEALACVAFATMNVRFINTFAMPACNAEGDPTGIVGWALSPIVQGDGPYAVSAAKFANPKSVYDMMNAILQSNFNLGVGSFNPPKQPKGHGVQAQQKNAGSAESEHGAGQSTEAIGAADTPK